MKKSIPTFPHLLEMFFLDRLMKERNASPHTVKSYRDTFRLLLKFAQKQLGKSPSKLDLSDLDAPFIVSFLQDLEESRKISTASRYLAAFF